MNKEQIKGNLLLLLTALIWGSAFVAQSVGMEYVGIFTFSAARSFIAFLVLIPASLVSLRLSGQAGAFKGEAGRANRRLLLKSGLLCGLALAAASIVQQAGIAQTTVGKAGFITALYIIIIPVAGIFFGKRPRPLVWLAVAVALAGMYMLCITGELSVGAGDLLILLCSFLFAVHIMLVDRFAGQIDGVLLSCVQFFVAGCVGLALTLLFEEPSLSALAGASGSLLYAGVLSSGVAYTLQILGQKRTGPVAASIIMSLESVFAALSGWLLLGQTLSLRELLGCALMFAAIIMAQLPGRSPAKSR